MFQSWTRLLGQDRDLLKQRERIAQQLRDVIQAGKEELLLSIPPEELTAAPCINGRPGHRAERLLEDAEIDDFSLLEVDLVELRRHSASPNPKPHPHLPLRLKCLTQRYQSLRIVGVQAVLDESREDELSASSPTPFDEGLDGVSSARTALERFASPKPSAPDPWLDLAIETGKSLTDAPLELNQSVPVEDTSSRTTHTSTPTEIFGSRSNLQAEPSVPVRERRSAELHTMDDSDLSDGMNAQTDLSESLEADEDTDLSIAQDVYLAEAEMVIHESVDVWRSPESDLKSLSSCRDTKLGAPDSMDDVIGARVNFGESCPSTRERLIHRLYV